MKFCIPLRCPNEYALILRPCFKHTVRGVLYILCQTGYGSGQFHSCHINETRQRGSILLPVEARKNFECHELTTMSTQALSNPFTRSGIRGG